MEVDDLIALLESRGLQGHDRWVYLQLRRACDGFHKDYDRAMQDARDKIGSLNLDIGNGNTVTPMLRAYIVDMIKMGLNDGLAMAILDRVYIQRGMYDEFFAICDDILAFEGEARGRMMGSFLVEYMINRVVHRLSGNQEGPQEIGRLAGRCVGLLRRRADVLGIDVPEHRGESNPLYRASLVSMDVHARRGLESPQSIARLLRDYPALCGFLGLSDDKIPPLVQKAADIAYHASIAIHIRQSAPRHTRPRPGPLDCLESLLRALEARGIRTGDPRYSEWRSGMLGKKLAQYLFEMRLYLHFLQACDSPELEPPIDNGKFADLRIGDLYIEAFAPHDAIDTAYGHIRFADSRRSLVSKIFGKKQICSFGNRRAVIVVEDPHDYVDDTAFQGMLARRIPARPQLAAIFVIRDVGDCYRCAVVRNPEAALGITPQAEQMVMRALGTPYM